MRRELLVGVALAFVACSSGTPTQTDTPDAGGTGKNKKYIHVTGNVQISPVELAWRNAAHKPINGADILNGDTINVEDAIRALSKLPPLNTGTLTSALTFDFAQVDVTNTTLALVASVKDKADPTGPLFFSGYGLGKPPFPAEDVNLPVYTVTREFVQVLSKAIYGPDAAVLHNLENNTGGFVIGQAVYGATKENPAGVGGIAGAQLNKVYGSGTAATMSPVISDPEHLLYYLNDDFTAAAPSTGKTSNSGVYVYVNAGGAQNYVMLKDGSVFEQHLSGSRDATALQVFFNQETGPTPTPAPDGGSGTDAGN